MTNPLENLPASTGAMIGRSASNSLNSVNYRMIVNQNPLVGSGVGGEDYANEVVAIGWNQSDTVGVASDVTKVTVWDAWEYKFNIGGKYNIERHIEYVDTSAARHRLFSITAPHDGTTGSLGFFSLGVFNINDS